MHLPPVRCLKGSAPLAHRTGRIKGGRSSERLSVCEALPIIGHCSHAGDVYHRFGQWKPKFQRIEPLHVTPSGSFPSDPLDTTALWTCNGPPISQRPYLDPFLVFILFYFILFYFILLILAPLRFSFCNWVNRHFMP
ncbi:hypothetical protein BDV25DRAFT_56839 [Aspergillus avenaceus]|uniref:Uncharacterized protein n=1 Tax=Aspergillus avenaceus TaxID=36643 RepID=A0A5N6TIA9_ASPAV|nr:hypothetical protein BDV25DRAFT_56839 [Aspergillus avenaceus]